MRNKLSVIVPVYNTEDYLDRCLKSIISQTYINIEIIVINDGSTDGSLQIIKEYLNKSNKIRFFNRINHGVGNTRNYGISKATGDYITFIDSDDYIDSDIYEECMTYILEHNLDILLYDFVQENGNRQKKRSLIEYKDNKDMYLKNLPNPWNKIIKKDLWINNSVHFPEKIWYEDLATMPLFYLYTDKIGHIHLYKYHYIIRNASITHRDIYDQRCISIIDALKNLEYKFKEKKQLNVLEPIFITEGLYFGTLAPIEFCKPDDFRELVGYIENVFPNWRNNPCINEIHFLKRFYLKNLHNIKLLRFFIKVRKWMHI